MIISKWMSEIVAWIIQRKLAIIEMIRRFLLRVRKRIHNLSSFRSKKRSININELPDSLILEIFCKLEYQDVLTCSKVCEKWERIANDYSLKKVIILKKSDEKILDFVRNHFTEYLREFKLQKSMVYDRKSRTVINKKVCSEICKTSRNIKKLELNNCQVYKISIQEFPESLQHLNIQASAINRCFFLVQSFRSVPQLISLELMNNRFTSKDELLRLRGLNVFKSLRVLNFGWSYVTDYHIEPLKEILPQLEILNLEGTVMTNEGVHFILNNCVNIRELLIGGNLLLDDFAMDPLLRPKVPRLTFVCIRGTDISVFKLHEFFTTFPVENPVKIDFYKNCFDCAENLRISDCDSENINDHVKHHLKHKCSKV